MIHPRRACGLVLLALGVLWLGPVPSTGAPTEAEPPPKGVLAPAPPEEYDVVIRYQIEGARPVRVPAYLAMLKNLAKLGWTRDPEEDVPDDEPENPRYDRFSKGTVSSKNARSLLL